MTCSIVDAIACMCSFDADSSITVVYARSGFVYAAMMACATKFDNLHATVISMARSNIGAVVNCE